MVMQTQEARSLAREDILRLIPRYEMKPLFLREHLKRELVIGLIGLRGDGKSAGSASIGLLDFMLADKPVWSNMEIKCDIKISDDTARAYGLNYGGTVSYTSNPLDKNALLAIDDRYQDGALVIEEINVQYSNVRRFMTNTNVDFNQTCQQLRKIRASLIYNVIDEMFIDPQLRGLTDIFVKVEDEAFDLAALMARKKPGVDFRWRIYPMSGYIAGREAIYSKTHRTLPPIMFHFAPLHGIYDSTQYQRQGRYSMSTKEKQLLNAGIAALSSPEMEAEMDERGWLGDKAVQLKEAGVTRINSVDLSQFLGIALTRSVRDELRRWGISYSRFTQEYEVNNFSLQNLKPRRESVVAGAI